ncbi:hypothetical protein [Thalassotalea atypica]|uniref:hypothetical protein n=1 Tax=Thalassotalea atypica TaxID=2054316 RepID=UPI00257488E9|nr:hypothetical protein [Thalassotalea atypica]
MKTAGIAIVSFIFGALLSGLIGFKFAMGIGYQAVIGKLSDNVIFYRQIEQGDSELTQFAIESSLEWFISMANDGENSIWVSTTDSDKQILARAKELQSQIQLKNSSK